MWKPSTSQPEIRVGISSCLLSEALDRPSGPERPVFGKIRYMSSESTARKVSGLGDLRP